MVDTAHPFSCPVIDVTAYVATAEMTMSRVIVKTIGKTWLDDFTGPLALAGSVSLGLQPAAIRTTRSTIPSYRNFVNAVFFPFS